MKRRSLVLSSPTFAQAYNYAQKAEYPDHVWQWNPSTADGVVVSELEDEES